jgi:lipopolysaccharide/colanic/teichoic acid biosynthesis glycosyltransferase
MLVPTKTQAGQRSADDTAVDHPALTEVHEKLRQWRTDPPHRPIPAPRRPRGWYDSVKVAIDRLVALALFIPALPIMLLAGLLVKLTSRGPVLYSQVRLGMDGRPFTLYKLRTMIHDCERHTGARWSTPGDPRITPVGRILRSTHLDELPQLWNVLRGDMSLIGPRPERPEIIPKLERGIPHYRDRLHVRPGVTGLAQVQLPPDTDLAGVRRKVAYDLYYIRHLGPWLDLRILACTVLHLFGVPCHGLCRFFLMPDDQSVADGQPALALGHVHQ